MAIFSKWTATRPVMAWSMVLLMIASMFAMLPIMGPAVASSRANVVEAEPNNDYGEAQLISTGDFVTGELDWSSGDSRDVFKISVQANQIMNVSFVQWEFNPGAVNEFQIDIEVIAPLPEHALIRRETKRTRVDHVSAFCVEQGEYFIWLYTNSASKSVNYTMNAEVTSLVPVGRGTYNGHLDATDTVAGTNPYKWYRLSIPTTKGIQVTLNVPQDADFDLFALLQWDGLPYFYPGHKNPLWLNASTENTTHNFEFVKATAFDGEYYLKLKAWPGSKGDYSLQIIDYDVVESDNDNLADQATLIDRKKTTFDHLDLAFDHFDWYKLNLNQGDTINITMTLLTNVLTIYNMSLYDQFNDYITGVFDTVSGNYYNSTNPVDSECEIINFTAPTSGTYYVMVMPVRDPSWWGQKTFTMVESNYKVEWDLPNEGPDNTLDMNDIVFDEDTEYSTLDLDPYFLDPEGDPLTYSVTNPEANLTVAIDQGTGEVTITPAPNWNTGTGQVTMTFRAEDPLANTGKLFDTADVEVKVTPINDAPARIAELDDVYIKEEETKVLEQNLYDIFRDIDDDTLSFTVRDNGKVEVEVNDTTGEISVGPSTGWYGVKMINITATDSGMLDAFANVTVNVEHVNHAPDVVNGMDERNLEIKEDQVNVSVYIEPWFDDIDMAYTTDTIKFTIGTPIPTNLLATIDTGFLKIVSLTDWNGEEVIWVVATDNSGSEAMVKLTVTVTPVNDPPVITVTEPIAMNISVNEGMNATFEVKTVEDIDTDQANLTYKWYLDEELVEETTPILVRTTDYDPSTDPLSEGIYKVKVVVSDGEFNVSFEWELTVYNVNQAPADASIVQPESGHVYKPKDKIILEAGTASDIDGDTLTYTWKDNATGEVLGTNKTLEVAKLKKGTYVIILEVTDGQGGRTTTTVEFTVKGKKKTEPGFEAVVMIAAVVVLVYLTRRRRT